MDLQTLERRRLMSVSVVEGYPGYYEVRGDAADDSIAIAISAADSSFTLDGAQYAGVAYLSIFPGGGNDTISVGADGPTWVGAGIAAGEGDDDVSLAIGGAVWGESGNDTLRLSNSFRGEIYGGAGDDKLYINGACDDAEIDGGAGGDMIDASGSASGVFIRGGTGDDTVFGSQFDDRIYGEQGRDLLLGNPGNDVFYAADSENDRLIGGAGVDMATVDACESGVWGVEYVFYV